jgi:hypothetical protein
MTGLRYTPIEQLYRFLQNDAQIYLKIYNFLCRIPPNYKKKQNLNSLESNYPNYQQETKVLYPLKPNE